MILRISFIVAIFFSFLMCPCVSNSKESFSKNHEMVVYHFKTKENGVKDAVWTSKDIFKIGMIYNKSPRDGYASYACEVLYEYGFKGRTVWVQIVDIATLVRTNKWVKIGEAHCE